MDIQSESTQLLTKQPKHSYALKVNSDGNDEGQGIANDADGSGTANRADQSDHEYITVESNNENIMSNSATEKKLCVLCSKQTYIETFDDLKPGDHIAVRGEIHCLGCCYSHHAIVKEIQTEKRKAIVSVDKTCKISNKEMLITTIDDKEQEDAFQNRDQKCYIEYCFSHNAIVNSVSVNKEERTNWGRSSKEIEISTKEVIKPTCKDSKQNIHIVFKEEHGDRKYATVEIKEDGRATGIVNSSKCLIGIKKALVKEIGADDENTISGQNGYIRYCTKHGEAVSSISIPKDMCIVSRVDHVVIETYECIKEGDHVAFEYDSTGTMRVIHVDVKTDNRRAKVVVIDVRDKDCRLTRPRCVPCSCCCFDGGVFSLFMCKYPITEHPLGEEWALPSEETVKEACCRRHGMRKVEYKHRQEHETTLNMASQLSRNENVKNLEYSLFSLNCEHLASSCAIASKNKIEDAPKEIISVQSHEGCWWISHVMLWIIQAIFYALNFLIYAQFVAKNKNYQIFSKDVEKLCYNNNSCLRGFDTRCDWYLLIIYDVFISLLLAVIQICVYEPLYSKEYICQLCLRILRLDCFSRVFTFTILEIIGINMERYLYKLFASFNVNQLGLVYFIVILFSVLSACITYALPSAVTFCLAACTIPTCGDIREFKRYFKFRGILFFLAKLYVCMKRLPWPCKCKCSCNPSCKRRKCCQYCLTET